MIIINGEIFFKKIEERKESNFNSIIASFEIKDKNGKTIELKPEIRIYNQPVIITSEADIRTTILEDKFLVMNLVKGNEYFNIRYQVKTIYGLDMDISFIVKSWWVNEFI